MGDEAGACTADEAFEGEAEIGLANMPVDAAREHGAAKVERACVAGNGWRAGLEGVVVAADIKAEGTGEVDKLDVEGWVIGVDGGNVGAEFGDVVAELFAGDVCGASFVDGVLRVVGDELFEGASEVEGWGAEGEEAFVGFEGVGVEIGLFDEPSVVVHRRHDRRARAVAHMAVWSRRLLCETPRGTCIRVHA